MAASDVLDNLRAQFPKCELVAFMDISAEMVLVTSAAHELPQERWDGLCAMALDVLRGSASSHAVTCLDGAQGTLIGRAALITAQECDIFLSTKTAPEYVMCAVGQADICILGFYDAAQPILEQLVQND